MACSTLRRAAAAAVFGFAALSTEGDAVLMRRRTSARAEIEGYSFERFVRDFGRDVAPGSAEYTRRAGLFEASLLEVRAKNARNAKEGRLWKAGVHPFMDWTPEERARLNGYKPSGPRGAGRAPLARGGISFLHSSARGHSAGNATWGWDASLSESTYSAESGGWSAESGPSLRNQGNCGSCWAISAVEALEAQLQKSGTSGRVSAQALLNCVPNPQHCGGSGGCDGATGELAYAFVRDHGVPMESELPYHAVTEACPQQPLTGPWKAQASRVRVDGWTALPSNKAEPLMQALTEHGPVVVAVDANNWFDYESGIFDGCGKDAILGHAVLAKGYGSSGGNKYWLIQNSWGADWGESGHIRLIRHDDEGAWCGTDNKPKEGVGCDGGPTEVTVCGTCGILYDPIYPTGVRIEDADSSSSAGDADAFRPSHADTQPAARSDADAVKDDDDMIKRMRAAMQ